MAEVCSDCVFWRHAAPRNDPLGHCHRFPAAVERRRQEFCGEFKAIPAPKQPTAEPVVPPGWALLSKGPTAFSLGRLPIGSHTHAVLILAQPNNTTPAGQVASIKIDSWPVTVTTEEAAAAVAFLCAYAAYVQETPP
jgi:hypothetical protein